VALAAWSRASGVPLVCVGAAGGKRLAQRVEVEDLADTTHDPLLASLRQRLRKIGVVPRQGRTGLRCVFSRESVSSPAAAAAAGAAADAAADAACAVDGQTAPGDGTLNCHGYGSSVTVTATFGLVAAGEVLALLQAPAA
jgi:tRNA A37 threonylcarbamoyladenosine dehydratase